MPTSVKIKLKGKTAEQFAQSGGLPIGSGRSNATPSYPAKSSFGGAGKRPKRMFAPRGRKS